ncbi:hypothetical protein CEXT_615571, partial [Caerostris extrusa]
MDGKGGRLLLIVHQRKEHPVTMGNVSALSPKKIGEISGMPKANRLT